MYGATHPNGDSSAAGNSIGRNDPLISIIIPVFKPRLDWLKEAVESVQAQSYGCWQLVVALDGNSQEDVLLYLQTAASQESRLQYVVADRGGISSTLNRGLEYCSGLYTGFLDQDDRLEPAALSSVAAILCDEPDVLYTDEDYVDELGRPVSPIFKPAWSPQLLLSCMYAGHLLVVRTDRIKAIGGFRSSYDGAQDYDLLLRLTDEDAAIAHIPCVLYHWRQHAGSTALSADAKPYSHLAGRKALEDTLSRRGLTASVGDGPVAHTYRLSRQFSGADSAAIIVPTRNPELLSRFLAALHSVDDRMRREVHVIAHCQGAEKDSAIMAIARQYGARVTPYRGPFNFSLMNNLVAGRVMDSFLIFMNDDVLVRSSHWLESLCDPFLRPEAGVVGARLRYPDGSIQHSGIVTGMGDAAGHAGRFQFGSPFWPWLDLSRNVSAVTGACLAIRREVFERVGGFDTRYGNNYNDVDLCLKVQDQGWEVVLTCEPDIIHDEGRTRQTGTALHERVAMWTQWGEVLRNADCFYSPNLSRRLEIIDLASPPGPVDEAGIRQGGGPGSSSLACG
ncbi:MAG TPA: glycosyltransferase [Bryobacteraceae bacterium]